MKHYTALIVALAAAAVLAGCGQKQAASYICEMQDVAGLGLRPIVQPEVVVRAPALMPEVVSFASRVDGMPEVVVVAHRPATLGATVPATDIAN